MNVNVKGLKEGERDVNALFFLDALTLYHSVRFSNSPRLFYCFSCSMNEEE
jgi:hypothetical protein